MRCDVTAGAIPLERLHGCGAIVNLVGIKREEGKQTFARVHVDASRHLLAAARHWVFYSRRGAGVSDVSTSQLRRLRKGVGSRGGEKAKPPAAGGSTAAAGAATPWAAAHPFGRSERHRSPRHSGVFGARSGGRFTPSVL